MSAFTDSAREWRWTPAAATAAAFVLLSLATGGLVVLPALPPLDPAVGLAVPLALLFGPAAVLGVAAGALFTAAFGLAISLGPLLDAVAVAVLAAVAHRLWGVLPAVATGEDPTLRSAGQWLEFAAVAVLAACTAVAVLAWATLVVRGGDFHAVVFAELPIVLVSTAVVGPAVIVPATSLLDDAAARSDDAAARSDGSAARSDGQAPSLLDGSPAGELDLPLAAYADRTPIARGSGAFWTAVLAPVLWIVVGSLASLVAALAQQIGGETFRRHGYGTLYAPVDPSVVGPGGRRVQIVFGAATLALVVAAYAPLPWIHSRDRTSTGGDRLPGDGEAPSSDLGTPPNGGDTPPSGSEAPQGRGNTPPNAGDRPSNASDRPSNGGDRPSSPSTTTEP